jgi:hypothetical protein
MSSIDVVFNLINKMSPGVQKIGQDVDKLNSKIKSVGNNANSLGSKSKGGVSGLSSLFSGLNVSLLAVGAGFTKLGMDIYKNTTEFENYETSLTTLTGSMRTAALHAQEIKEMAKSTPLEFKDLAKLDAQFLGTGMSIKSTTDNLKLLADVGSGVGGSADKLATLGLTLAQSFSKGKVDATDLLQIGSTGVPIKSQLSKDLGVTGAELEKLVSAGKVGYKDLQNAYTNMTKEGGIYYGAATAQSKTLSGQMSNLSDTYSQATAQIGNALMNSIGGVDFSLINDGIDSIKEGVISAIGPMLKIFETLKPAINSVSNLMKTMFSSVDASAFFDIIDKGADIISSIVTIVGDGLSGIFSSLTESGYFESFKSFFDNIYIFYKNILEPLLKGIVFLAEIVLAPVFSFIKAQIDLISGALGALNSVYVKVNNALGGSATLSVAPKHEKTAQEKAAAEISALLSSNKVTQKQIDSLKFDKGGKVIKDDVTLLKLLNSTDRVINGNEVKKGKGITGGTGETDRFGKITSSAPKIQNINILTGNGSSLVSNMDINNMIGSDGKVDPTEVRRVIEVTLLDILNRTAIQVSN